MSIEPLRKKPLVLNSGTTRLVVVEGQNEVDALRTRLGDGVQVFSADSKDKIAVFLLGLHDISGFAAQIQKVVVMLDNDDDPQSTQLNALRWLEAAELVSISKVLTVPADGQTGMLEDILLADNASLAELTCIEQFFDCTWASSGSLKPPNGKARFQAWLSIKSPGAYLGRAISKNKVRLDGPQMSALIARLKVVLDANMTLQTD